MKEILKEIENTSEFIFFYNDVDVVNITKKVDLSIKSKKIEQVLDILFEGTDLTYLVDERQVFVYQKNNRKALEALKVDLVAQQDEKKLVKGTVKDGQGLPMVGATIAVKGTSTGIVADIDGNFTMKVPANAKALVISFIGMKTQEVLITGKTSVNVVLEVETVGIDEVVAIGYGTQKKESVTGAIATMKAEDVKNVPVPNLSNSLNGRISGVFVTQASGAPGYAEAIRVRAINTWKSTGNEPLYVIDGVITEKTGFDALDYSEVDNITVLKDAASGAVYGARAANGVILVTTNRGKTGKFQLNYNYSYSFDQPSKLPGFVNNVDMMRLSNYSAKNLGLQPNFDEVEIAYFTKNDPGALWWKDAYQNPVLQKHSLTASGGTEKVKYFLGGSFFDQTAFIRNADYKKYNLRSNIDVNFTKNLSGSFNFSYNQNKKTRFVMQEDIDQNSGGLSTSFDLKDDFGGLWGRLLTWQPTTPPYVDDGEHILSNVAEHKYT